MPRSRRRAEAKRAGSLALLLLAACPSDDPPPPAPTEAPAVDQPTVWLANCQELAPDGACLIAAENPQPLRIWVDQYEQSSVRVMAGDTEVPAKRRGADGGLLLEVVVPEAAGSLAVEGVEPRWRHRWEVAIRPETTPAVVLEAIERRTQGDSAGALERLHAALDTSTGTERVAVLQELQALHYNRGDLAATIERSGQTARAARQQSRLRTAARAASSTAYLLVYRQGRIAEARPYVELLEELAPALPEAAVWSAFARGLVARALGDTTRALESFRTAAQTAERLGMNNELLSSREALSIAYGELARGHDAVQLAQRLLLDAERPEFSCMQRYAALNQAGWVQLLLQQRQVSHLPPAEFFERALALVGPGGECPREDKELNLRINLALAALAEHDPAMALAWIEPVDLMPGPLEQWADEVRARAGLALGRWELVPASTLLRGPDPRLPRGQRWNASMRQAEVRAALGMRQAAIDAYAQAEGIVDEAVATIGVDLGRELFLFGRQASARGLVHALVRSGQHEQALCRARMARGRALRMLDRKARLAGASATSRDAWETEVAAIEAIQRELDEEAAEDWSLSAAEQGRRRKQRGERRQAARRRLDRAYERLGAAPSEGDCASLPRLAPGEVMLLLFPLDEGWLGFVSGPEGVTAHEFADPPAQGDLGEWTRRSFAAAADTIDGASALRLLPTGRSWDVPFHALPWREGVLLDVAPVRYSLDLASADPLAGSSRSALVVADPSMDLPQARDEAQRVSTTLRDHGWSVDRVEGAAATLQRVTASLPAVNLLHYAGHGEHKGTTGWDARLLVGEGEGMSVTDILALPRAPDAVVLSGCETGRITRDTLDGGMNLGRAFVLAGSAWVVAADRRVADELSGAMGQALYDALGAARWDGPRALRQAQLSLRDAHPRWDWAAFRAIVR